MPEAKMNGKASGRGIALDKTVLAPAVAYRELATRLAQLAACLYYEEPTIALESLGRSGIIVLDAAMEQP